MRRDFLAILRCPNCLAPLELLDFEGSGERIESGTLVCSAAGERFSIRKAIPRFVESEGYGDSFNHQRRYVRRHFEDYRRDRSGFDSFERTTGLLPADLKRGQTLEVGCGYGRFVDVIDRLGGRVVGMDLSGDSIELAGDFLGDRPGIELVQADLRKPPFAPGTFANVFSIGVLDHTPDTHQAFAAIAPLVAPKGKASIWVYHPEERGIDDFWRQLTTRLPYPALIAFCVLNQALFGWARGLPGGWRIDRYIIPGMLPRPGRTFWMRVLGDFDNFASRYTHSHREEEVQGWFREQGFENVRSLRRRTAVTGSRSDGNDSAPRA